MTTKHDKYVLQLCEELDPHYDSLETHVTLSGKCRAKRTRIVAEIDIVAYKAEEVHVFEVKCSHRISKAKRQLKKIKKLVKGVTKMFFFCGESGNLVQLRKLEERVLSVEEIWLSEELVRKKHQEASMIGETHISN